LVAALSNCHMLSVLHLARPLPISRADVVSTVRFHGGIKPALLRCRGKFRTYLAISVGHAARPTRSLENPVRNLSTLRALICGSVVWLSPPIDPAPTARPGGEWFVAPHLGVRSGADQPGDDLDFSSRRRAVSFLQVQFFHIGDSAQQVVWWVYPGRDFLFRSIVLLDSRQTPDYMRRVRRPELKAIEFIKLDIARVVQMFRFIDSPGPGGNCVARAVISQAVLTTSACPRGWRRVGCFTGLVSTDVGTLRDLLYPTT
jgi:hypothetical protein